MLLALVRLESPTGSVFKNGTENLNGVFCTAKKCHFGSVSKQIPL